MPYKSEKQKHLMQAVAHNPAFAKKVGIPQSVGKKFEKHDSKEFPSLLALPSEKQEEYLDAGKKLVEDAEKEVIVRNGIKELKDQLKDIEEKLKKYGVEVTKADSFEVVPNNLDTMPEPAGPAIEMPVDKDAGPFGRASGIMMCNKEGRILFIRRGEGGDYPGSWAIPGGHENDTDKDLKETAIRECFEETGIKVELPLEELYDNGQFMTYIAKGIEDVEVKLNYESTGYDWADPHNPPQPLHPAMMDTLKVATANTDLDRAKLIRDGVLPSPQLFANVGLFAIRITGTGLAFRSSIGEFVWRDPSLYLNEEFLERCNGLIVIRDHPETSVLTPEEFKERVIGSIMLSYIKGDEVWGIAKIYDQDAVKEMCETEVSTSPSVVFDNTANNTTLMTEDKKPFLIEGIPFLLDHIAIVTEERGSKGVWDKGGDPAGVLINNPEVSEHDDRK